MKKYKINSACHVTYSLLLICRQKVEVYFRTISSESVIEVLQNGSPSSKKVQNLRLLIQKKIPGAFGYTFDQSPHEYKVRIDDDKFRIIRQDDRISPEIPTYTRKVGHGAQAAISAVTLVSMESNFIEICLETVRIIRKALANQHEEILQESLNFMIKSI